jgi:cold shock CspA family protein
VRGVGVVVHWNRRLQYGKVRGADRRSYFVHASDLVDVAALTPGQRVVFTPTETARGPRAVEVQVIERARAVELSWRL